MKYTILSALVFFSLLSFELTASANLHDEIACYKALLYKSMGANFMFDDDTILIPAERDGRMSIYAYTNDHANNYRLPSLPLEGTDKNYYFALSMPDKPTHYISFTNDPEYPSMATSKKPLGRSAGREQQISGGSYLCEESRAVLHRELNKRIITVHEQYETALKDNTISRRNPPEADNYMSALQTCAKVEEVRASTFAELAKFQRSADFVCEQDSANTCEPDDFVYELDSANTIEPY